MIACLKLLSQNSRRQCRWRERKQLGIMDSLAELLHVHFWNTQNLSIIDVPTSTVCFPFWRMAIIKTASTSTLIIRNYDWKILSVLSFISLWLGPRDTLLHFSDSVTPNWSHLSSKLFFCTGAWYEWNFILMFSLRPHGVEFRFSGSSIFSSLIVSSSETY
jgi:hypothetical protein